MSIGINNIYNFPVLPMGELTYEVADFQLFLKPEKESPLSECKLTLEILLNIGRMCPDVKTATAFTRTCKELYLLRPEILTTSLPLLQDTIQTMVESKLPRRYIGAFLEVCKTAKLQDAEFKVKVENAIHKFQIIKVFPKANVEVVLPLAERIRLSIERFFAGDEAAPENHPLFHNLIRRVPQEEIERVRFIRRVPQEEIERFVHNFWNLDEHNLFHI